MVVDAGAMFGVHTVHFAKKAKLVVAVEPEPRNLSLLSANVKQNNLTNVVIVPVALSNKNGRTKLFLSTNPGGHTIITRGSNTPYVHVRMRRLDDLLRSLKIDVIDVLKIDVEGAEQLVLEGLGDYLNPLKTKAIVIEVSELNLRKIKETLKEYKKLKRLEDSNWLFLP